jgi:hypothetical protein
MRTGRTREGGRTARWDSPKEEPSRNISLTELVGGASMSVNVCLCLATNRIRHTKK